MKMQRGGFVLGLVVGLLIGLALALGVALYVTKVPVPFIDKVPQRTAEQDAAEAQKNRGWEPNAPLATKPITPLPAASAPAGPGTAAPPASAPGGSTRDPAALLAGKAAKGAAPAASGADPNASIYFVQVGAFQKLEDAESQRAKLGLQGMESRLVEREQSGRTVYRVRVGPYERQAEAETVREKLTGAGFDAMIVPTKRPAP